MAMRSDLPMVGRFLAKFVFDILPAALASVIGGFLFTHYQLGRAVAPEPPAAQVAPASAEMMRLFRDEHALIVDFLKAQVVAEKNRLAEDERGPRIAVDAKAAPAAAAPRHAVTAITAITAIAAAKAAAPASKLPAAGPPRPPFVIAQEQQTESVKPSAGDPGSARDQASLVAKTIGIKDHVVAVTQHVVSVISGIPSWIGAIGDRIGGDGANSPPADLVSAAS